MIGVLREEPGPGVGRRQLRSRRLSDIPRLVEETRRAGAKIDFEMQVDHPEAAPERARSRCLPHRAGGAHQHRQARPRHGGAGACHRCGRSAACTSAFATACPSTPHAGPTLPGSGAGLLGLQERVTLAGGTLVHGPDGSGDFVVDAELPW